MLSLNPAAQTLLHVMMVFACNFDVIMVINENIYSLQSFYRRPSTCIIPHHIAPVVFECYYCTTGKKQCQHASGFVSGVLKPVGFEIAYFFYSSKFIHDNLITFHQNTYSYTHSVDHMKISTKGKLAFIALMYAAILGVQVHSSMIMATYIAILIASLSGHWE